MSVGLTVTNYVVATVETRRVALRPILGGYELTFPIQAQTTPVRDRAWWFRIEAARVKLLADPPRELGVSRPDRAATIRQNNGAFPQTVDVVLSLQRHQLTALEDARGSRDLDFSLTLLGEGGDGAEIRESFQTDTKLIVPRSEWLEQLRTAGALDVLLLEIPMPVGVLTSAQAAAAGHLRQAQLHFYGGHYADCVGALRLALDAMGVTSDPLNFFAANRNAMMKTERGQALYAAIRHFAHPAHHVGADPYDRSDAKLMLQLVAACTAAGTF